MVIAYPIVSKSVQSYFLDSKGDSHIYSHRKHTLLQCSGIADIFMRITDAQGRRMKQKSLQNLLEESKAVKPSLFRTEMQVSVSENVGIEKRNSSRSSRVQEKKSKEFIKDLPHSFPILGFMCSLYLCVDSGSLSYRSNENFLLQILDFLLFGSRISCSDSHHRKL